MRPHQHGPVISGVIGKREYSFDVWGHVQTDG